LQRALSKKRRDLHRGRREVRYVVRAAAQDGTADDGAVELLTERYRAALDEYQNIVDRNSYVCLHGGQASLQSLVDEERAFEALDCARHALFIAAERAYPTIH
jgi:hypothetical protein